MWDKLKEFFEKAWSWVKATWDAHDEMLAEMVSAMIPLIVEAALRSDLSGEEKRIAIVKAVLDNAEDAAEDISTAMLNEAVEVAAARYNIQLGKQTVEQMQAARDAALKASRDFAERKLKLEAETEAAKEESVTLTNEDVG